jgi:hypothetical protein
VIPVACLVLLCTAVSLPPPNQGQQQTEEHASNETERPNFDFISPRNFKVIV